MIEVFYLDGVLKRGSPHKLRSLRSYPRWIDCTDITQEEANLLAEEFKLHPTTVEDIMLSRVRIKVEEFPNYLFSVFYTITDGKAIRLGEMDMVLGRRYLISSHRHSVKVSLKNEPKRAAKILKKGPDFLFHHLIDNIVDDWFPPIDHLEDRIEELEEQVTISPETATLSIILRIKRLVIGMRRAAMHQREKLSMIVKGDYRYISRKTIPYFRDIHDHSIRVVDALENVRESASSSFEVYMSAVSHRMNEVMKVLSVIATIALPLTVVSSIYGTNFAVLPGASWPHGFWAMLGFMATLSASMIYYFRRRGWF